MPLSDNLALQPSSFLHGLQHFIAYISRTTLPVFLTMSRLIEASLSYKSTECLERAFMEADTLIWKRDGEGKFFHESILSCQAYWGIMLYVARYSYRSKRLVVSLNGRVESNSGNARRVGDLN